MKYILTIILFFLMQGVSYAEEVSQVLPIPAPTTPAVIPFDSYGNISNKDEKIKLQKLGAELKKDDYVLKYGTVFIIAYGDQCISSAQVSERAYQAKQYLVKNEKILPGRVSIINGDYRENSTIEIFIVAPGALPPDLPSSRYYELKAKKRKCKQRANRNL